MRHLVALVQGHRVALVQCCCSRSAALCQPLLVVVLSLVLSLTLSMTLSMIFLVFAPAETHVVDRGMPVRCTTTGWNYARTNSTQLPQVQASDSSNPDSIRFREES